MTMLFDLLDFAPATPTWAEECYYCRPAEDGTYDEQLHQRQHLPIACTVCGDVSPNRLLFEMNHAVNLGASYERRALLCVSLALRLNHLSYDLRHGQTPHERDLTACELGWRFAPDGTAFPPEGWSQEPGGSR